MKYMGSKARIAKHILPIMLKNRAEGQWWVEPFVGGANMIDKVEGNRLGADLNKPLIACLDGLSSGWLPQKEVTEEFFNQVKKDNSIVDIATLGYIGTQLTYGAMWFSTYRRDKAGLRDYANEAFRHVEKQASKIKGVTFKSCSYSELDMPTESIIYCDPPYKGTAKYKAVEEFDHDVFFEWCRSMAKQGHTVFISEYNAPDDFISVWQKEITSSLGKDTGSKKGIEKLFVHESQVESDYHSLY